MTYIKLFEEFSYPPFLQKHPNVKIKAARLIRMFYPDMSINLIEKILGRYIYSIVEYNKDGKSYIISKEGAKEIDVNNIIESIGYKNFEIELDKSIKNNNFLEFSKIFNSGSEKWKEKYKRKRSKYDDIIDGSNIGIFSLK